MKRENKGALHLTALSLCMRTAAKKKTAPNKTLSLYPVILVVMAFFGLPAFRERRVGDILSVSHRTLLTLFLRDCFFFFLPVPIHWSNF